MDILNSLQPPNFNHMTTLILGATAATGKQLLEQLLSMQQNVKVILRPTGIIPDFGRITIRLQ